MLHKFKKLFFEHWPVVILAFIIGFLVVYPTIDSIYKIGIKNFRGIYPIFTDDEEYYIARTQEVLDGHPGLGNLYLKEHKNEPFMAPPLAEIFFAYTSKIFHIPLPKLFAICDFLLPFIGVIVLYGMFLDITKSKKISASLSFLFYLFLIRQSGRAINHQFIYIFLFLGFWMVWKIYDSKDFKQSWRYNIFLGIVFAILLYIYPFFWTPFVASYGFFLLFKIFITKNWADALKNAALFGAVSGILATPYLINLTKASSSPFFSDTVQRLGLLYNHWPASYFNIAPILGIGIALFFLHPKLKKSKPLCFAYIMVIAGILINWQNVITGKYLMFSAHYHEPTFLLVFIVLAIIINEADFRVEPKKFKNQLTAFIPIVLIFLVVTFMIYRSWDDMKLAIFQRVSKEEMLSYQDKAALFDWLIKNTPKDSSIYYHGEETTKMLLPVYTASNLYIGGYSTSFLVSDDELLERWARYNLFNDKINAEFFKDDKNTGTLLALRFIDNYQNKEVRRKIIRTLTGIDVGQPEYVPAWFAEKVKTIYEEAKKQDPEKALKKYALDYIIIDENDENAKKVGEEIDKIKDFKPVKRINNYQIYKVE